jgi:hypothetical protein
VVVCKIYGSPRGSTPGPPPLCKAFTNLRDQHATDCFLICIWFNIIFKFNVVLFWRGVGPGLSPGPWSLLHKHMTILYICVVVGARGFDITLGHISCAICPRPGARREVTRFYNDLTTFAHARGHMTHTPRCLGG